MNKARRVNPIKGILVGMTASNSEINTLLRYREGSRRIDAQRTDAAVEKFRRFLAIIDALRSRPEQWVERDAIAALTGYTVRNVRRILKLLEAINHPHIEVRMGSSKDRTWQSQVRWTDHKGEHN